MDPEKENNMTVVVSLAHGLCLQLYVLRTSHALVRIMSVIAGGHTRTYTPTSKLT